MPAAGRLALFAVLLAVVFGGAALLGGAIDPSGADEEDAGHGEPVAGGHGADDAAVDEATLPGLAVAQDGLRLVITGREPLRFRIVDDHGAPVRDFDVAHEKRMHVIVVRRDLRGFQHLHPRMDAGGTWSVDADLGLPGVHRVYADFTIDGEQRTLGADVHVAGPYDPRPVPASATVSPAGDLEVRLRRDGTRFAFDVLRDGRPVDDELEPYLGAKGHLVTLRTADLAYLHTHPDGDELAFDSELPSAGTYRLWVQFQLDGRVQTAAFTQEVTP